MRRSISSLHPALYFMSVWTRRWARCIQWFFDGKKYSRMTVSTNLPFRVKKHQSVLLRNFAGVDMGLQLNKVENLKIAIKKIDGIIIKPGEMFSFCKLVGYPSKHKGYKPGMELSNGKARAGIGGGLCQISNLIHWMVLHSPLMITERYHHSFDPFPDDGRVLPFGSGATVFYNYRDFQFKNNLKNTFQIRLWLSDKCLNGDLRCMAETEFTYHIEERGDEFLKIEDKYYRRNELWRHKIFKINGKKTESELILKNFARVMYTPKQYNEYK